MDQREFASFRDLNKFALSINSIDSDRVSGIGRHNRSGNVSNVSSATSLGTGLMSVVVMCLVVVTVVVGLVIVVVGLPQYPVLPAMSLVISHQIARP